MDLNTNSIVELIILLGGPLFQFIAYYVLIVLLPSDYKLISTYHYSILLFNLLPIYPLDGGKIIKILFDSFISYKKSLKLTIYLSYFFMFIIIIKCKSIKLNIIIMIILLLVLIIIEHRKVNYIYNKFILERYLNNYNFKKSKIITNINNLYRGKKHLIKDKNTYYLEKEYLEKTFKKY